MISLIVPVYNEEKELTFFCNQLIKFYNSSKYLSEIIIVNDGSTDSSLKIIKQIKKKFKKKNIKIVSYKTNQGMGYALKRGIKFSTKKIIGQVDADSTHKIKDFDVLANSLLTKNLDMVIGNRYKNLYSSIWKYFVPRHFVREIMRLIACYITNYHIKDINSGFRIYKKKMYSRVKKFLPNGFSFVSSITCLAINKKYKIEYIDIFYNHRDDGSKIRPIRDTLRFLKLLLYIAIITKPKNIIIPIVLFILFTIIFFIK
jgi:glycosyltransferase involved in cell wall biosynthesis